MAGSHTSAAVLEGPIQIQSTGSFTSIAFQAEQFNPTRVVGGRGGNYRVYGTTKIKGTPDYAVSRRVRLFRDSDGACVGEAWSNATTGAFEFVGLNPIERYTALAYDHTHNFRAVVADNQTPEAVA